MDWVRIFDTTLRDGEQSPGATMTPDEKIRLARKLDGMGVDVIEAGFPAASVGELSSVQQVCAVVQHAKVAALCRTRTGDIRAAWDAIKDAKHPRLHVFIATSDIHLEHKLQMTREQVLEEIRRGVSYCRELCADVEFSAEDATRSDLDFLVTALKVAVECGATTLNVPDTVGYTLPHEYEHTIRTIVNAVGPDIIVSSHCHDDLGLAVANSLAAIRGGARQVEGCMNGIGERAGNAALEEVIMALKTRPSEFGVQSRVDTKQLVGISRMVRDVTGIVVQPNKAIVGRNAFAHEAGIHQHGVLASARTYEIMDPVDVGWTTNQLVLGKHSGKHALKARLESLGFPMDEASMVEAFVRFKALCDRKKEIYDEDLVAIAIGDKLVQGGKIELESIRFESGTDMAASATVTVRVLGRATRAMATGDGPVNAALEAIRMCTGVGDVVLEDYRIAAISVGTDAQGQVNLRINAEGVVASGQATHTDVVVASAQAYIHALNHLAFQRERFGQNPPRVDSDVLAARGAV